MNTPIQMDDFGVPPFQETTEYPVAARSTRFVVLFHRQRVLGAGQCPLDGQEPLGLGMGTSNGEI